MNTDMTLKKRVQAFWMWFSAHRRQLERALAAHDAERAAAMVGKQLEQVDLPILCEAGTAEGRYMLSMSPCGDKNRQFACRFWAQLAPRFKNWDIRPFRRPDTLRTEELPGLFQRQCNPETFVVYCQTDEEEQRYHIHVVSEELAAFGGGRVAMCRMMFYLLLGEAHTDVYIGKIRCSAKVPDPVPKGTKMTLTEFCTMVRETPSQKPWPCILDPTSLCFGYQNEDNGGDGMREDIFGGFTRNTRLLNEPGNESAEMLRMGGVYCYLYYEPKQKVPQIAATEQAELTGKLEQLLDQYQLGCVVGSAQGADYCYIDLMIADEPEFRAVFRDLSRMLGVQLYLEYFGRTPSGEYMQ